MPSQYFVPGPAHLALGVGTSRALVYAGLSERGATLTETQFERNVVADIGGTVGMPSDVLIAGKLLTISMQIIWRNPLIPGILQSRFYGGQAGILQAGEVGSLMLQESLAFQLMILSQYPGIKSVYSAEVPGINVANAYVTQNVAWNLGTTEQVFNVTFKGLYLPNYSTTAWTGWNTNTTGFPTIS
jgi:hypothetical protein